MALVAGPPTSVWRDPNLLASSSSILPSMSLSMPPVVGGLSPGSTHGPLDGSSSPLNHNTTPVPGSDVSQQSSDSEERTGAKDENGQEISCVVCHDKSSGKHYGQFTCEGRF